ncbi:hypothetical protein DMB38_07725 [Streptomyces sp. WAC 06738]|nr:hypothetical protein DMB38_07725 [Streptomyces sp. WAC 06738]
MDDADAWRRIKAEDGRVALITKLAEDDADTFGGSWYDGATDTQHLQATTPEAAGRFTVLAADRGIKAEVHQVDYSYARLTAEADQARAGEHPVLGDAAKGDAAVDVKANRVVAGLTNSDLKAARTRSDVLAVPDTFKVKPRSTTDPAGNPIVDEVCNSRFNCSKPLRSGIEVTNVRHDPDLGCSLGFTAYEKNHPKRKFALTAAHCGEPGALFKHNNWSIGHLDKQIDDGANFDVARVRIENPHWLDLPLGWIYNSKNKDNPYKVTGRLTSEAGIQAGQTVCLAAKHNGSTGVCGTINGLTGAGFYLVTGHDACPGDSGGGWYRKTDNGRIAYGIHKGGSEGCHGDQGGSYDIFTPIGKTQAYLDVTVHTR